jgi:hypothetical protein
VRIPTPKKIPPSLKEYSVGQLSEDYLPIITTTTTTTTTTYTHLILATLSFYFWPMPNFFCRMPNFMRPGLCSTVMGVLRLSLKVRVLHEPKNDQSLCNTIMVVLNLNGVHEICFVMSRRYCRTKV